MRSAALLVALVAAVALNDFVASDTKRYNRNLPAPKSLRVQYKSTVARSARSNIQSFSNPIFHDRIRSIKNTFDLCEQQGGIPGASSTQTVEVAREEDVDAVIEALRNDPTVASVQRDLAWIYPEDIIPDDPQFPAKWDHKQLRAPEVWDLLEDLDREEVVVCVIDTGVQYTHPDLRDNMWVNEAEFNGEPGVDDDNNGYVDDIHGINTFEKSGDPDDIDDHGSHCAGIVAATGNNGVGGIGIAGPGNKVKIMACNGFQEVFDDDGVLLGVGALSSNLFECLCYASFMGARLTTNSYGGSAQDLSFQLALQRVEEEGQLFVAAAGNDDRDINNCRPGTCKGVPTYPGSFENPIVLTVASTDPANGRSWFSNYGSQEVDIGAPGSYILSTVKGNRYDTFSGTSMATPQVAGIAATLLTINPKLTGQEVKQILMETAAFNPDLDGITVSNGVVDFLAAVRRVAGLSAPQPAAPTPNVPAQQAKNPKNFKLHKKAINFVPNNQGSYDYCIEKLGNRYPIALKGATKNFRPENTFDDIQLKFPFTFFGITYNIAYLSDNGYLTFGFGETARGRGGVFANHWSKPRIAGLFGDLSNEQGGKIRVRNDDGFLSVTWHDVPQFNRTDTPSRFQINIFADGRIQLAYRNIRAKRIKPKRRRNEGWMVGLSAGHIPSEYKETKFKRGDTC
mmetsp:Transcript_17487/g.48792  ORF Transcript_17487/g.48792 Transcript_17487/m.48792 type:complete len:681 (+) Transcript_17487:48-2090(+)